MYRLHFAELRDSWSAWLGVCTAFIVVNSCLALAALTLLAGVKTVQSGLVPFLQSTSITFIPGMNIVFCSIVGAIVIASSTSLVIDSRRGSLARLALSGATPAQIISTIMSQLVVVTVVCALLADSMAYLILDPTLHFLANNSGGDTIATPSAIYSLWPVLAANLLCIGLALIGGYKQARRASRIPPVEAVRRTNLDSADRMTVWRWVSSSLWFALICLIYCAIPVVTSIHTSETISNLIQGSLVLLIASAALLSRIAPLIVGGLTRAWTKAIPSVDPSWYLARSTAIAKSARLTKSVIPVMIAIGLLFGMVAIGDTLQSSLIANGFNIQLSSVGLLSMATLLGMPLAIALAGSVGSLVMMSKQRDAELALSSIVGTTPLQRIVMPILEATIITITGTILALVMVAISILFLAISFPAAKFNFSFTPSYTTFAVSFAVCFVITAAATVLPTLRSLRRPEPRVIARLVAE